MAKEGSELPRRRCVSLMFILILCITFLAWQATDQGGQLSLNLVVRVLPLRHLLPDGRGTKKGCLGWVWSVPVDLAMLCRRSASTESGSSTTTIPEAVLTTQVGAVMLSTVQLVCRLQSQISTYMESFTVIYILWPLRLWINYSVSCTNAQFAVDPCGNRPQGALSHAS